MAHGKLSILRRRLLTVLSVLLLLLCLATLALWVRSYWRADQVGWYVNRWTAADGTFGGVGFDSDSGGVVGFYMRRESHLNLLDASHAGFRQANPPLSQPSWITHDVYGYPQMTQYSGTSGFGFGYFQGAPSRTDLPMTHRDHFLVMPLCFLAVLFAILPAFELRAIRRARRGRRAGLCPVCGYDLRATPDRCPECGTPKAAKDITAPATAGFHRA